MNDVNERQTIEEIEARFPSEWVLIGDPETDQGQHLRPGASSFTAMTAMRSTASSWRSARPGSRYATWGISPSTWR